ncbi:MAG: hypothetical protein ACPF9K_10480 [Neptuniibacter sp.]
MYKVLIWISVVSLGVLAVKTQFLTSSTFEPFKEGCMKGNNVSEERCHCLAKYVHKHFSDNEVKLIMSNRATDPAFRAKVEEVVHLGSQACAAE